MKSLHHEIVGLVLKLGNRIIKKWHDSKIEYSKWCYESGIWQWKKQFLFFIIGFILLPPPKKVNLI